MLKTLAIENDRLSDLKKSLRVDSIYHAVYQPGIPVLVGIVDQRVDGSSDTQWVKYIRELLHCH